MIEGQRPRHPDVVALGETPRNLPGYFALVRAVYELYPDDDLVRRAKISVHAANAVNRRPRGQHYLPDFFVPQPDPTLEEVAHWWQSLNPGDDRQAMRSILESLEEHPELAADLAEQVDVALNTLTPRLRAVLRLRYQLDKADSDSAKLKHIGEDLLGVTVERARQLDSKGRREAKQAFQSQVKPLLIR